MGIVSVLPGIAPASMIVAPNSPKARAKLNKLPAIKPGRAKGSRIRQKIVHSEAPKVRPQASKFLSIWLKEASAVLYIKGNETTIAAITTAYQVKTIRIFALAKMLPITPFLPRANNNKKPTTVGGKTKGAVKTASIIALPLPL